VWAPVSTVYFNEPSLFRTSTNGLAAAKPVEAALHALYELIERDALAGLEVEGRLKIKEKCKIIDLATITDESLQAVIRKIQQAQSKLVLLWLPSCIPVHTCWAILLNQASAVSLQCRLWSPSRPLSGGGAGHHQRSNPGGLVLGRVNIIAKPVYAAPVIESSRLMPFDRRRRCLWYEIEKRVDFPDNDLGQSYLYSLNWQGRPRPNFPLI
jgi:hypothetical protein